MQIVTNGEDIHGAKFNIAFSNENFDNDNYVEMNLGKETFDISLNDLSAMINAFSHLRVLREERDNQLK